MDVDRTADRIYRKRFLDLGARPTRPSTVTDVIGDASEGGYFAMSTFEIVGNTACDRLFVWGSPSTSSGCCVERGQAKR